MTEYTPVVSGGVTVTARDPVRQHARRVMGRLWIDQVPVRLASEDCTLWPSAAAAEAEGRALCWPGQPGAARALLGRVAQLRARAHNAGLTEVALLGGGPPARAADVIVRRWLAEREPPGRPPEGGGPLTVFDSADPGPVARLAADRGRLGRTLVVATGDDPGTDALCGAFTALFGELGLSAAETARRFVTVAPAGSRSAKLAAEAGHAVVEAPSPTVFGALSPYALVPAGLAGADVAAVLDAATAVLPALTRPENNPGLVLGAILGGTARAGRGTVVLGGYSAAPQELADWIAPMLAGATHGRLLPVVQHGGLPVLPDDDLFLVTMDGRPRQDDVTVSGPLAAQLVVWEYAAAVAGHLLGEDPLARPADPDPADPDPADPDPAEPDPAEPDPADEPVFVDGHGDAAVAAHTADPDLAACADLPALLDALAWRVADDGHLAIVAFCDPDPRRGQGAQVRRLAGLLAARTSRPVTVTWGRRLPATGNDRRERGVYLMLTGNAARDVPVAGRHRGLGAAQSARASAVARAARRGGRPVVRLHLQDRRSGLARLLELARGGA
ncbi:glucose-6-phosphate isomerase [Actinomadura sp. NBRC 104425]|uniref:glucose-6-phosphate isomerase n=1 Tax=Actinomadura sp. NBRC 104425 TaxID=3032204 RepID=UPI0024A23B27|nr:glucose-6-phosphate isomerase [Actinomadura sp. NBRC 104425]GLZ13874.1 glucose-6-phosphate isomerase [Actinomadura sp. NBRC 104425]